MNRLSGLDKSIFSMFTGVEPSHSGTRVRTRSAPPKPREQIRNVRNNLRTRKKVKHQEAAEVDLSGYCKAEWEGSRNGAREVLELRLQSTFETVDKG